jgi:hypothetical protein
MFFLNIKGRQSKFCGSKKYTRNKFKSVPAFLYSYLAQHVVALMVLMFRAESQKNHSVSKKDSRPNTIVIAADDLDYFNMVVNAEKLQG